MTQFLTQNANDLSRSVAESDDSCLLSSKVESKVDSKPKPKDELAVDISLRPNNTVSNIVGPTTSRDPLFRVWYDKEHTFYRVKIMIRVENFGAREY